jgi:hypothetical protein
MAKIKKKLDYNTLYKMLVSTDEENKVLGLSIMEEHDFKSNIMCNFLLYKNTNVDAGLWEKHCGYVLKHIRNYMNKTTENYLTYKVIFNITKLVKVDNDQLELYLQQLNNFLINTLKNQGYDYIESINVKLNIKEHEPNRELSKSS